MKFDFHCPHCGAKSQASNEMIGKAGPCFECKREVIVTPPSSLTRPPQILHSCFLGMAVFGSVFIAVRIGLRTTPALFALWQAGALRWANVFSESMRALLIVLLGAALGAMLLSAAAFAFDTRRGYLRVCRGIWIGGAVGLAAGLLIGFVLCRSNGPAQFFTYSNIVATAMLTSGTVLAAVGGIVSYPLASLAEGRIVRQVSFTAPEQPRSPAAKVVVAEAVVESPPPPTEPRGELTRDRRQELIRRLGMAPDQDGAEEPGEGDK
ncbi:MAG: hypothetical protein KDB14_32240 [Planctomycetales bacterium]|nr:hypothetical protein [Planctomycetales bacterium]